ncbi:MAG: anthranilate synthase component I [Verrucomicrobiota bacterium]
MIFPTKDKFKELSQKGNLIPVYKELIADLETPVSVFMKLDNGGHTFLLESAEGVEKFGRYSFIGSEPNIIFSMRGNEITIRENGQEKKITTQLDPLQELQKLMKQYKPATVDDEHELPIFYGGAVGYLSYEAISFFEPTVPVAHDDDLDLPDAYFIISDTMVLFDHHTRRMKILVNTHVQSDVDSAYDQAIAKISEIENLLDKPLDHSKVFAARREAEVSDPDVNMTQDYYVSMTERMQEHIRAGDIFQVVPSQRFAVPFDQDPLDLYRALRFVNPSPYMFCLKFDDFALVGASPETHVRCEDGMINIRPIAGTRPRKEDLAEDYAMEEELLADPKERAEHLMLVDLARNDLGRVCEFNTVEVTDFMIIERYSHVMHIVSNVIGKLKDDQSVYDVMRATFPAGTVTGSPKIRAMQIIAENEPTHRGPYAGAVGYFGFSGNLDSCITIRTITLKNGQAYVQAGGGLVADSTPIGEYNESVNKAKAGVKAIAQAKAFK